MSEKLLQMCKGLHVKCPLFLSDCNENLILSTYFRKIMEYQNLMKIRLVGAELFHADDQTDVTKPIAYFRNFAKAPKKQSPHSAAPFV
jgi:hypothetical protein